MKPDGVNMETTEPIETTAAAEPSPQDNTTDQGPSQPVAVANDAPAQAAAKTNGRPGESEPKVKPNTAGAKVHSTTKSAGTSGSSSRPGTGRTGNGVSAAAVKKSVSSSTAKASLAGAVPKRPVGIAAVSGMAKNQTRVPDKKSVATSRTTSVVAVTATNGTKPTTGNGTPKRRPAAETGAKPKTSAAVPGRTVASAAPKTSTSTTAKVVSSATSRTTRPPTGPSTSRAATSTSRPTTATTKPSTTTTVKTAVAKVNTAPSTGKTTAAQPPKTSAAFKKDVSRPPSAAVAKKPAAAAAATASSAAIKKPDPSKPIATVKLNSASKSSTTTKTVDAKVTQPKPQQPAKPTTTKMPVAAVHFRAINKPPLARTQPASPANKLGNNSTSKTNRGTRPTQAVPPFTAAKKTEVSNSTKPAAGTGTAAAALAETQAASTVTLPQESVPVASAPKEVPPPVSAIDTIHEAASQEAHQSSEVAASPQPTLPQTSPPNEQLGNSAPLLTTQEQIPVQPVLPPVDSPPNLSEETPYMLTEPTPPTSTALPAPSSNAIPQIIPPTNLNEEEEEEDREGSQLVSVSEMSGTTQPTEESRPGSAGPMGSAWRAGGALLSELDSEEVSGSQQGASELSAPGVLEGTESMDDLGDGSLKGAIDMEGASAGSPDFEKVPDIPVNDFDEDEDDDEDENDRVCDMDVGSERVDEPQRPRHDNDVDEDEDDDVEMASEGVTESGLESYGNADEDDFAEDERLDNLNRVAQPPPAPPALPSAPAAQWDQPNPFPDPWAGLLQPQQVLDPIQVEGAAAASPLADPWQADSETPIETPAQPWLEQGCPPFVPEDHYHSIVRREPQNLDVQMAIDQSSPAPMQTLAPAPVSAPGMSLSSTLSSETSTPEELGEPSRDGKLQPQAAQAPVFSSQPDLDLGIHLERGDEEGEEEAEPETLPADEVLGGPRTAPTSSPSSSSVTEDEASDTEGEAQLDDSLGSPAVIIFDTEPPAKCCLSTVEEREEAEMEEMQGGTGEDTTPPSATSLASYGFDTMTTASNSNAQSTGECCIRSPGIFSLEELSEEAKEPNLVPQPPACLAEPQYIDCGKQEMKSAEHVDENVPGLEETPTPSSTLQQPEEIPDDIQTPYYSAICEKTEDSLAGFTALPHPHRRDHPTYPRTYCDIVKPHVTAATPPKLTCADLPPRSPGQQALSPQLRRLEQHQRQLLELQQRREQQTRPLEEAEQERKRREEEEQRKKKDEAEEEIKRNKEEEEKMKKQAEAIRTEEEEKLRKEEEDLRQRRDLELQLQQQQQELKQRQQIMQWQQELQQCSKGQTVVLSPSSGLCTIYEALENSEDEAEGDEDEIKELQSSKDREESYQEMGENCERVVSDEDKHPDSSLSDSPAPLSDSRPSSSNPSQDGDSRSSPCPPQSPEQPPPLDLDWGKKVDIVQQLINQTLMLNRDCCSSLLVLPGGAGGTLSPLESSLWPSILPPLTPPSATVTSVSSFSPEATGSAPQGEWTVVELETHH